jgi:hypothetical protein
MPDIEKDEIVDGKTVSYEDSLPDVEDTEDGGAIIKMKNDEDEKAHKAHFANIVDEVDKSDLSGVVNDLLEKIDRDKEAREKRDKQYEEGLRRTGLGDDAPGGAQFAGANRVVHPMLVEACVDFSARVVKELFPATGPVRAKIFGAQDKDKIERAQRKAEFMNWQTTEQMVEFRGEVEQLSTQLPLGGGQYMKIMWSNQFRRPVSEFVAIDDIYLPFAATNFYTAERKTHVQYITEMEYSRRVKSGMYLDVDLGYTSEPEYSRSSNANDKIEGRSESCYNEDGLRTIYEVYTFIDFGDGLEPYILSIDKSSMTALALYRNWEEDDNMRRELDWIVEFPFVPWRGAYPIGLTHMIGGLSGAATGALRALLDSAHIQNIPSLLKLKGGPSGQTINIQPTEVVELDGGALIDDIRKLAMPIPFNGPSQVLFSLLGFLVDSGKGIVQTTFEKLSDQNPNQPVGTTMALIEQGMVVFSSIHSRLHASMARCFKIIHRLDSAYLTEDDISSQSAGIDIDPSDFDGKMDIIPVSDPGIFSETQRFAQVQAIMQRATAVPQMYDMRKVEGMFLRAMKVPEDEVLNPIPASDDMDPVSENVSVTMGAPIYVLPKQEHVAHIRVHMSFLKSPMFGGNVVIKKTFLFPMVSHLRDHLLNYYLVESHTALEKALKSDLIKDEAEEQVPIIEQVQTYMEQQLAGLNVELAKMSEEAEQFRPQPNTPPDSSLQIAQINAQVQGQSLQLQKSIEDSKLALEQQKIQLDNQFNVQKLQIETQLSEKKLQVQIQDSAGKMQIEQIKQAQENQRKQAEITSKELVNEADNTTARDISAAEIESGDRVSMSTGAGIDPNPGS